MAFAFAQLIGGRRALARRFSATPGTGTRYGSRGVLIGAPLRFAFAPYAFPWLAVTSVEARSYT